MFNLRRALTWAGVGWPLLVLAAALLWPGPVIPSGYASVSAAQDSPTVVPPVDSGSELAVAGGASTRIFWTIPEEGTVEITIEIDPQADNAGAPGPQD